MLEQDGSMIALKGKMPDEEIQRLPPDWKVEKVVPLTVPGMQAERHLMWMKRAL